jgi:ribonucleoside-diphosphate reductase beta chain
MEERAEDDVLLTFAACHGNRQDHGPSLQYAVGRMLPRKSRILRSVRVDLRRKGEIMILDPGFDLTLRPMKYPVFYEQYKAAIKNTWTVEEVDFSTDLADLKERMTFAEEHLINRLVAFFATGDSIVGNNLVLNLYKHINSPEARMYLSRQLFEEAQHVDFYLTLLDTYIADHDERKKAFDAIENIPSIRRKAEFCFRWIDSIQALEEIRTVEDRRNFLLNLICFACCIEGLFFFAAFAYVYFLRSRGLLHGLAAGTNWVFRDESAHIQFALEVIKTVRQQEPELFDKGMETRVVAMLKDAVDCEMAFADDVLSLGVSGLSPTDMREYLQYVADRRIEALGIEPVFHSKNPFGFMELQEVQELTNFFECRVSAYQVAVKGEVAFHNEF